MRAFVDNSVDYLYQHFGVERPSILLHCEQTCPWASKCQYLACYQPWNNKASFKSGSEKGYIIAHEFGHHLENMGIIENGEPGAMKFERWWLENMNEYPCQFCNDPLFISEDAEIGTEVLCETCGSVYEAVAKG